MPVVIVPRAALSQLLDMPRCGLTMLEHLVMRLTPPTVPAQIPQPAVCPEWFNATCSRGAVEVAEGALEPSVLSLVSLNNA
jgi:hypothetical protein